MSTPFHRTVMRKKSDGTWLALRMYEDQELYRVSGDTWKDARKNLVDAMLRQCVQESFNHRNPIFFAPNPSIPKPETVTP
jgi:hypothetical protein